MTLIILWYLCIQLQTPPAWGPPLTVGFFDVYYNYDLVGVAHPCQQLKRVEIDNWRMYNCFVSVGDGNYKVTAQHSAIK